MRFADVRNPEQLEAAMRGVEVVVHCAAITANLKEPFPGAYDAQCSSAGGAAPCWGPSA